MTKPTARLTALKIKTAPPGKHQDGGGLILDKATAERGAWLWRYTFAGIAREMGLGSYPAQSLAEARKSREKWASVLAAGKDPITERKRLLAAEKAALDRNDPALEEAAQGAFKALQASLRGAGERGRWFSPIRLHILPKLGKKRLSQIHQTDIAAALRPIWTTKHPTAEKAIQRLGIIFKWARLSGFTCDPFTVEAARHILGEVNHKPEGIAATPWQALPALYKRLGSTTGQQALRMTILTLARTDSVRGMRYSEIDGTVWTVPADRMKSGQAFRYPLSPQALALVEECREFAESDFVFPGYRRGKCITEAALLKALNDMGEDGRPHGFRTSFRTYVQDTGAASYDVAETVLAHSLGNRTERTYARSDMLDQRRALMIRWADFVTAAPAVVVGIRA